jgi:hypothetical protein
MWLTKELPRPSAAVKILIESLSAAAGELQSARSSSRITRAAKRGRGGPR